MIVVVGRIMLLGKGPLAVLRLAGLLRYLR